MRHWKDIPLFKGVTEEEWNDWRWQWRNRIEDVDTLLKVISLSDEAIAESRKRWRRSAWPSLRTTQA